MPESITNKEISKQFYQFISLRIKICRKIDLMSNHFKLQENIYKSHHTARKLHINASACTTIPRNGRFWKLALHDIEAKDVMKRWRNWRKGLLTMIMYSFGTGFQEVWGEIPSAVVDSQEHVWSWFLSASSSLLRHTSKIEKPWIFINQSTSDVFNRKRNPFRFRNGMLHIFLYNSSEVVIGEGYWGAIAPSPLQKGASACSP